MTAPRYTPDDGPPIIPGIDCHLWPTAECLHEHTCSEARIVNGAGQVVRIIPEYCYDCGYEYPIDTSDLEARP